MKCRRIRFVLLLGFALVCSAFTQPRATSNPSVAPEIMGTAKKPTRVEAEKICKELRSRPDHPAETREKCLKRILNL